MGLERYYRSALLIINGQAGQAEKRAEVNKAIQLLTKVIPQLEVRYTENQGDAERMCQELGESYDLLIILGGDGTVHECINGLASLPSPPTIGILPGGTCNDFSRALAMPQDLEAAAAAVLAGRTRQVDLGRVNERYFSNFCGIGLITEASSHTNPFFKDLFGKLSYYISALQALQKPMLFPYKLKTPQQDMEDQAAMILVANGSHLGTTRLPLLSLLPNDGQLDVFIIRQAGFPLLKEWLAVHGGKSSLELDPTVIQYFRTPALQLETGEVMEVDIDGEIYLKTPLSLTVLQQKMTFAVGSN